MTDKTNASTFIAPNPSEVGSCGDFIEFTELDCIAVSLGQKPGTPISIEALTKLLNANMMSHAIEAGRSELIEKNKRRYLFCGYGDRAAHGMMRDLRAYWPVQARLMNAEFILSLWVDDELKEFLSGARAEAKADRRAAFDAETTRFGRRLTVERARQFVASELEISMRDTIRRTVGLKADEVLALAA